MCVRTMHARQTLVAKQDGLKRRQVLSLWYSLTSISILLSDRCRLPQQGTLAGQFTCVNDYQQMEAWVLGRNPAVAAGSTGYLHALAFCIQTCLAAIMSAEDFQCLAP